MSVEKKPLEGLLTATAGVSLKALGGLSEPSGAIPVPSGSMREYVFTPPTLDDLVFGLQDEIDGIFEIITPAQRRVAALRLTDFIAQKVAMADDNEDEASERITPEAVNAYRAHMLSRTRRLVGRPEQEFDDDDYSL